MLSPLSLPIALTLLTQAVSGSYIEAALWAPTLNGALFLGMQNDSHTFYGSVIAGKKLPLLNETSASWYWRLELDAESNITFIHNKAVHSCLVPFEGSSTLVVAPQCYRTDGYEFWVVKPVTCAGGVPSLTQKCDCKGPWFHCSSKYTIALKNTKSKHYIAASQVSNKFSSSAGPFSLTDRSIWLNVAPIIGDGLTCPHFLGPTDDQKACQPLLLEGHQCKFPEQCQNNQCNEAANGDYRVCAAYPTQRINTVYGYKDPDNLRQIHVVIGVKDPEDSQSYHVYVDGSKHLLQSYEMKPFNTSTVQPIDSDVTLYTATLPSSHATTTLKAAVCMESCTNPAHAPLPVYPTCGEHQYRPSSSLFACKPCPMGAQCLGSKEVDLLPLPGFWKPHLPKHLRSHFGKVWNNVTFLPCPIEDACVGTTPGPSHWKPVGEHFPCLHPDNYTSVYCNPPYKQHLPQRAPSYPCATGYRDDSIVCGVCEDGYWRRGSGRCEKCPKDAVVWGLAAATVVLTLVAFSIFLLISSANSSSRSAAIARVMFRHIQLLALVSGSSTLVRTSASSNPNGPLASASSFLDGVFSAFSTIAAFGAIGSSVVSCIERQLSDSIVVRAALIGLALPLLLLLYALVFATLRKWCPPLPCCVGGNNDRRHRTSTATSIATFSPLAQRPPPRAASAASTSQSTFHEEDDGEEYGRGASVSIQLQTLDRGSREDPPSAASSSPTPPPLPHPPHPPHPPTDDESGRAKERHAMTWCEVAVESCLLVLMNTVQLIGQSGFSLLACTTLQPVSGSVQKISVLTKDPNIPCMDPAAKGLGWSLVALSGLLLPAIFAGILYSVRKRLSDPTVKAMFGTLYRGLHGRSYWWEALMLWSRTATIAAIVLLHDQGAPAQLSIAMAVELVVLGIFGVVHPYRLDVVNAISIASQLVFSFTMMGAIFIATISKEETIAAVELIVAIINIGLLLVAISLILYPIAQRFLRRFLSPEGRMVEWG